jgi:hypothetical protein
MYVCNSANRTRFVTVVTALRLKCVHTCRYYDNLLLGQGTLVFHKTFWWFYRKWCLPYRVRSLQSWCVHPCLTADSPAVNKTQSRLVPDHQTLHPFIFLCGYMEESVYWEACTNGTNSYSASWMVLPLHGEIIKAYRKQHVLFSNNLTFE